MAKILVVEDEWIVADEMCATLRKMGYLVPPPVATGEEAIKKIAEEKPDLVILIDSQGFNMPLAKFCKKVGIKTVYYIAPQEWL